MNGLDHLGKVGEEVVGNKRAYLGRSAICLFCWNLRT